MCDLKTERGAFLLPLTSPSSTLLRFLLRSLSFKAGSGTSSVEGTVVSQYPIRPSQDAVRTWVPAALAEIEETGAVCRWREARAFDSFVLAMGFSVIWVRRAVRSCEALAMMSCCESSSKGEEETRQSEVMGAGCAGMLAVRFLERSNARRWPSYEAVRKYLKKRIRWLCKYDFESRKSER